jgi:hypothetical protein
VTVNTNSVYFGTIVIGDKIFRKIQLINKGALGTNFKLMKSKELKTREPNNDEKTSENQKEDGGIEIGEVY